jgi:uncharacterized membrane protein (UPF0182 family)
VIIPTLIALGVLIVLFGLFTNFYTDLLWYRSVGFSRVYTTELWTKILLFFVFGLLMAGVVALNIVLAYRHRPAYRGMSPEQQSLERYRTSLEPFRRVLIIGIPAVLGLLGGSSAASEWRTYLLWRNGADFGVRDPQFNRDVGFFAFDYPWWRFILGFCFGVLILAVLATVVTHYLYGGLKLQTPGDKTTQAARVHISVLLGVFVLLKAVAYWFDRYGLAIKDGTRLVGLQYTDVNAVLPAKTILAIVAIICGLLFFVSIFRRGWMLPGIGLGLLVLCAVLIGGVYPAVIQQFRVKPSEVDREKDYIALNIKNTRTAYGLDDVEVTEYQAQVAAEANTLAADQATVENVRLIDPAVVPDTFTQLQQIRGFYDFPDSLDVDRYIIDREQRDMVVAVRELNLGGLPQGQRNWINDHTVYTHGYGFVGALGNSRDAQGRPVFESANIPATGDLGEAVKEPRVYFGEDSPAYSIVGAPSGAAPVEFDFPDDAGGGQQNTTYNGEGGVTIGSLVRRVLYAVKFQEGNILLSNRLNSDSRILYERVPRERVQKAAPWLTVDGDPYPAVVGGRVVWLLDGYTTTNGYPYSARTSLGEATTDALTRQAQAIATQPGDNVNYIRNSVKATVDAYDGTVTLYAWDESDPVLKTWRAAFPGTVKDRSEINPELLTHFRYPEDLFKVQRELLARYHVSDPASFYSGSDFWRVPKDPTRGQDDDQPPYYLTLQMPGQQKPAFSLTSTFVPTGDRENLTAFMAVNAEPGADYGKLRVLQVPRSLNIKGPRQVQNDFSSSDQVAQEINLLRRGDSDVVFGNLLTLPVGNGFLYVEPVYVKARVGTSFPLLRKVLVSFGESVAFEDTLQEGLDVLFEGQSGAGTGEQPGQPGTGTPPPSDGTPQPPAEPPTNPALAAALADAQRALADSQAALREGDFAAYGEAQKRLSDAINRALAAERAADRGATPTPSPTTPAPTPSPT